MKEYQSMSHTRWDCKYQGADPPLSIKSIV